MGRGGSNPIGASSIIDTDVEFSQTVQNPLQPSSAYRESRSKSRDASSSRPDSTPVNHHVRPGIRTIASAILLFTGGIILIILGAIVFFDTSTVVSKDQGLDMLIIGAVSKSQLCFMSDQFHTIFFEWWEEFFSYFTLQYFFFVLHDIIYM